MPKTRLVIVIGYYIKPSSNYLSHLTHLKKGLKYLTVINYFLIVNKIIY